MKHVSEVLNNYVLCITTKFTSVETKRHHKFTTLIKCYLISVSPFKLCNFLFNQLLFTIKSLFESIREMRTIFYLEYIRILILKII